MHAINTTTVSIGREALEGELVLPRGTRSLVLFAHGSGSSRRSPRNLQVARVLQEGGIGTLLFDLLTPREEAVDRRTSEFRFDVERLSERLSDATEWVRAQPELEGMRLGYFGASTGAAAALLAAARHGNGIGALVLRGGRPDLAGPALPQVVAPTLLIVGGADEAVLELNRQAYTRLLCEKYLAIVPRASHLFEEPGALETVADYARDWFCDFLSSREAPGLHAKSREAFSGRGGQR